MPPTNEQIREKTPVDVYATLLILSFLFTAGASFFLYDELTSNWGWQMWGPATKAVAVHVTQQNDDPEKNPDIIKITETDRKEYKLINNDADIYDIEKGCAWPAEFDPLVKVPYKNNAVQWEEIRKAGDVLIIPADAAAAPAAPAAPATPVAAPAATTPAP